MAIIKCNPSFIVLALLASLFCGCSRQSQALYDYLRKPVAPPANLQAAYAKAGLINAIQDAAQSACISNVKVEVDDAEFPFLVGVVCANRADEEKLEGEIGKSAGCSHTARGWRHHFRDIVLSSPQAGCRRKAS